MAADSMANELDSLLDDNPPWGVPLALIVLGAVFSIGLALCIITTNGEETIPVVAVNEEAPVLSVLAGSSGRINNIYVVDGQQVDVGTPLFDVDRDNGVQSTPTSQYLRRSPMRGEVSFVKHLTRRLVVADGDLLMAIKPSSDQPHLAAYVDEATAARLRVMQLVRLRPYTSSKTSLLGRITKIVPVSSSGRVRVAIELEGKGRSTDSIFESAGLSIAPMEAEVVVRTRTLRERALLTVRRVFEGFV